MRLLLLTILILYPLELLAEVVIYEDSQGKTFYVDSLEKVPQEYRDSLKNPNALPNISRPGSAEFFDTKKGDYKVKKKASDEVEIYVTSWCGYCRKLEKFLTSNGVAYSRFDVEKDAAAKKRFYSYGGNGYPLSRVNGKIIKGYDEGQIRAALRHR